MQFPRFCMERLKSERNYCGEKPSGRPLQLLSLSKIL